MRPTSPCLLLGTSDDEGVLAALDDSERRRREAGAQEEEGSHRYRSSGGEDIRARPVRIPEPELERMLIIGC